MIRKYAQNLLSRVKRSEKSVQELRLPKSPTFSSVWMKRYQFAGPLRKTSVNMVPANIAFHSNRSHSSRISTASHLHLSACASLWLRPVRAILYTWLTSLRGTSTDDLYDATLECARGKFFPVWRKIGNYRFGIFNFDAELEWCKFRALTVHVLHVACVCMTQLLWLLLCIAPTRTSGDAL